MEGPVSEFGLAAGSKLLEFSFTVFVLFLACGFFIVRWWFDNKTITTLRDKHEAREKEHTVTISHLNEKFREAIEANNARHKEDIKTINATYVASLSKLELQMREELKELHILAKTREDETRKVAIDRMAEISNQMARTMERIIMYLEFRHNMGAINPQGGGTSGGSGPLPSGHQFDVTG